MAVITGKLKDVREILCSRKTHHVDWKLYFEYHFIWYDLENSRFFMDFHWKLDSYLSEPAAFISDFTPWQFNLLKKLKTSIRHNWENITESKKVLKSRTIEYYFEVRVLTKALTEVLSILQRTFYLQTNSRYFIPVKYRKMWLFGVRILNNPNFVYKWDHFLFYL